MMKMISRFRDTSYIFPLNAYICKRADARGRTSGDLDNTLKNWQNVLSEKTAGGGAKGF